jgi:hypothetical protein
MQTLSKLVASHYLPPQQYSELARGLLVHPDTVAAARLSAELDAWFVAQTQAILADNTNFLRLMQRSGPPDVVRQCVLFLVAPRALFDAVYQHSSHNV